MRRREKEKDQEDTEKEVQEEATTTRQSREERKGQESHHIPLLREGRKTQVTGRAPYQRTEDTKEASETTPIGIPLQNLRTKERKRDSSKKETGRIKEKEKVEAEEAVIRHNGAQSKKTSSCRQGKPESQGKGKSESKSQSRSPGRNLEREGFRRGPSGKGEDEIEASCSIEAHRRKVQRRRRGRSSETPYRPMDGRNQGSSHERKLLGRRSPGRRDCQGPSGERGRDTSPIGPQRVHKREFGEVEREPSFSAPRSSCLPTGLCQDQQGWHDPHGESYDHHRQDEAAVDGQSHRRGGAGGRVGPSAGESCRGRSSSYRKGGRSVFRRRQERQEEKERKEKGEEEKGESEGVGYKGLGADLRRDGAGPRPIQQEAIEEKGKEAGQEEEGGEKLREQQQLRGFGCEPGGRGGARRAVRRRSSREEDMESLSRYPHPGYDRTDARSLDQSDGADVGCRGRQRPAFVHHVLEASALPQDEGSSGPRVSDFSLCSGHADPRQDSWGMRRVDPAPEILRTDFERRTLHHCPEAGAHTLGGSQHVIRDGDFRGEETSEGGEQGIHGPKQNLGQPARGPQTKSQRKRKTKGRKRPRPWTLGWKQRRQRKEGRRQRKEPRRELKDSDNRKAGDEKAGGSEAKGAGHLEMIETAPTVREGVFHNQDQDLKESLRGVFQGFCIKGRSLSDVADDLHFMFVEIQRNFKPLHGKTKCSGGIFPLPDTLAVIQQVLHPCDVAQAKVLRLLCIGLNSYFGVPSRARDPLPKACVAAVKALGHYAGDVCLWEEKFVGVAWEDYMTVKTVDYHGEEVKVAKGFCWSNIEPALPDGIGSIPLGEICELGTRDFVLNFEDYLVRKTPGFILHLLVSW